MHFPEIPLAGSPDPSWLFLSALFRPRERVIEPPLTVFKKSGEICAKLLRYLDITSLRGGNHREINPVDTVGWAGVRVHCT